MRSLILARSPDGHAPAPDAAAQVYHDRHLIAVIMNLEKSKQIVHAVKSYVAREVVGALVAGRRARAVSTCLDRLKRRQGTAMQRQQCCGTGLVVRGLERTK